MLPSLTQCNICAKPFTHADFPSVSPSLVFTVCFHIFHQSCLSGWVTASEKKCPLCNVMIYKHQAGKTYEAYRQVFLKALQHDPQIIRDVLKQSDHKNITCTVECLDYLPLIPLRYDPKNEQLFHDECQKKHPSLTMQELTQIVQRIVKKDPYLEKLFIPQPPTFLQRVQTDRPLLFRVVVIGSISTTALLFNHYKYGGESWILFALSLPAYLTLWAVQQVGLLIIALLNAQSRPQDLVDMNE